MKVFLIFSYDHFKSSKSIRKQTTINPCHLPSGIIENLQLSHANPSFLGNSDASIQLTSSQLSHNISMEVTFELQTTRCTLRLKHGPLLDCFTLPPLPNSRVDSGYALFFERNFMLIEDGEEHRFGHNSIEMYESNRGKFDAASLVLGDTLQDVCYRGFMQDMTKVGHNRWRDAAAQIQFFYACAIRYQRLEHLLKSLGDEKVPDLAFTETLELRGCGDRPARTADSFEGDSTDAGQD